MAKAGAEAAASQVPPVSITQEPAMPVLAMPAGTLDLRGVIEATLARNANVRLARSQLDIAEGGILVQRGAFDWRTQADLSRQQFSTPLSGADRALFLDTAPGHDNNLTRLDTSSVGVQRRLESGLVIRSGLTHNLSGATLVTPGGTPVTGTGSISFGLTYPLLRGGMGTAALPLRISELESQATRFDLEATVALSLFDATARYWSYLSALRRLQISRDSEARGETLLGQLQKLADADELPRAELQLVRANLNDRRFQRLQAEQAVLAARLALGRTLGLGADEASRIGMPVDEFPGAAVSLDRQLTAGREALAEAALERRAELLALARRDQAAGFGIDIARNNALPQLDLSVGLSSNGLSEMQNRPTLPFVPTFDRLAPAGYSVGVTFSYPLGATTARGQIAQQQGLQQQTATRRQELAATVRSNVERAVFVYQSNRAVIDQLESSRKAYEVALDNEKLKRSLGLATLIDVLNVEDRLTNASLALAQAQGDYASAIALLLFESGQIIDNRGGDYVASADALAGR
ncbi:MAG: TolC family protein [Rhodocyclaceae bacterium]|nr:TolC family protein [Rhodocyclaceae bacterium]